MSGSVANGGSSGAPPRAFSDTDLCVKCGLCLPHCPTYVQTLDESESPRGRLSLIQGWAAGSLEASPKLLGHLDNCLLCRACEIACPANVPYGRLVDDFRSATSARARPAAARARTALMQSFLNLPRAVRLAANPLARQALRGSGLLRLAGFGELEAGLPEPLEHGPWAGTHPARGEERARVGLFLGCTAEIADGATIEAAIRLLTRIGITVLIPEHQSCCGALAAHGGDSERARALRDRNLQAFDSTKLDAILSLASGCGAMLQEYGLTGPAPAGEFAAKVMDISRFLSQWPWPENIGFHPLPAKAALHTPCTLKNVQRAEKYPAELLRRIPELEITTPKGSVQCCGAAGSYMLEHPAMAGQLRDDLLPRLIADDPQYVLTSNVGCALHLRAGLKLRGRMEIRVSHPIVLLDQALAG